MNFSTVTGETYKIEIDFNIYNNFEDFYNYVLQIIENTKNTDNCIIKYIYKEEIINSKNYNNLIKKFNDTTNITIIFQELPKICSTLYAFAIINNNKSKIICWGESLYGGDIKEVQLKLRDWQQCNKYIVKIYSNNHAFAAINEDGNVITWGILIMEVILVKLTYKI